MASGGAAGSTQPGAAVAAADAGLGTAPAVAAGATAGEQQQALDLKRLRAGLSGSGKADGTEQAKRARLGSSEPRGGGVPGSPDRCGAASPLQLVPQSGAAAMQAGPATAGGSKDAGVAARSGSGGGATGPAPTARLVTGGSNGGAAAQPAGEAAAMVHAASLESLIPSCGPANAQINAGMAAKQHRHQVSPRHRHHHSHPPRPQPAAPAAPGAAGGTEAQAPQTQQAQRDQDAGGQPSSRLGTLKRERSPSPSNGEGALRSGLRPLCMLPTPEPLPTFMLLSGAQYSRDACSLRDELRGRPLYSLFDALRAAAAL